MGPLSWVLMTLMVLLFWVLVVGGIALVVRWNQRSVVLRNARHDRTDLW